jgi:hypothetical protein
VRDFNQPFALSLSKGEHFFGCHLREGGDPGFEWYRALCARSQNLIAVPRTAGGFLSLLVQRKKPKKARPGWRESPTALLAEIGARLNSPGAKYAPRAQTRGSLLPIPAAMLGRAIREGGKTIQQNTLRYSVHAG